MFYPLLFHYFGKDKTGNKCLFIILLLYLIVYFSLNSIKNSYLTNDKIAFTRIAFLALGAFFGENIYYDRTNTKTQKVFFVSACAIFVFGITPLVVFHQPTSLRIFTTISAFPIMLTEI